MRNRKIAVLYGGLSNERNVSLKTGNAVFNALKNLGFEPFLIDVGHDLDIKLRKLKPDFCFIALHGKYGEDGTVQGMLEMMGLPYSGASVTSSVIAYDKFLTKVIAERFGIKTPEFYLAEDKNDGRFFPCVVKPSKEGSTIGINIVFKESEFERAYTEARRYDNKVLVERYVEGKELTVGIVGKEVLPPIWIKPKKGFYDYESKYTKGMTDYVFETGLNETELNELERTSKKIADIMGCSELCRIDYIFDGKEFFMLEVNTIPGMTETSLLPKAAAKAGYSFEELILKIMGEK